MRRHLAGLLVIGLLLVASASGTGTDVYDEQGHKVPKTIIITTGGKILSVTTSDTGANWVNLPDQPCTQVTVYNLTDATLSFRRGGTGESLEVPDGIAKTFRGITNANQISVKRFDEVDSSAVTFKAEAENQ